MHGCNGLYLDYVASFVVDNSFAKFVMMPAGPQRLLWALGSPEKFKVTWMP